MFYLPLFVLTSSMLYFLVCKDGNTTYKPGEKFVTDDCLQNCTCFRRLIPDNSKIKNFVYEGDTICSPLCDARFLQTQCGVGLKVEKYKNRLNGTSCFCNGSRCVKRKYL